MIDNFLKEYSITKDHLSDYIMCNIEYEELDNMEKVKVRKVYRRTGTFEMLRKLYIGKFIKYIEKGFFLGDMQHDYEENNTERYEGLEIHIPYVDKRKGPREGVVLLLGTKKFATNLLSNP